MIELSRLKLEVCGSPQRAAQLDTVREHVNACWKRKSEESCSL